MGRAETDVTAFLEYFCRGMAKSFAAVRVRATEAASRGKADVGPDLRALDVRKRRLLELFRKQEIVRAAEIAQWLGLSLRTVLGYCRVWVKDGFLEFADASRKGRAYRLGRDYRQLVE
jgi:hypothetical protein